MATHTTANSTGGNSPVLLVQVFKVLAKDRQERLKRYNERSSPPLNEAKLKEWTQKWQGVSEAIWIHHPLIELIGRINELSGIGTTKLEEAAMRINTRFGLQASEPEYSFLPKRRDLNRILPKIHELDRDGSSDRIVRELVTKYGEHEAIAKLREQFPGIGRRQGLKSRIRKVTKRTEPTREMNQAYEAHKKGFNYRQIGAELGRSHETARTWAGIAKKYWEKRGRCAPAQRLPTDKRGQPNVPTE